MKFLTIKKVNKHWNRCDVCGRFISYEDFKNNIASRKMILPDSEISSETYQTLCAKHNE